MATNDIVEYMMLIGIFLGIFILIGVIAERKNKGP